MDKGIEELNKRNMRLRYLLWLHHGCPISSLYGDDGEMQCGKCIIDFKRDSIDVIEEKLSIDPTLRRTFFKR